MERSVIEEAILDYSGPILSIGNIDNIIKKYDCTEITAKFSKSYFAIINNWVPNWVNLVMMKSRKYEKNILVIKNIDEIDEEDQCKILDIVASNKISSFSLPENLIVILNAEKNFILNEKIKRYVEIIEV